MRAGHHAKAHAEAYAEADGQADGQADYGGECCVVSDGPSDTFLIIHSTHFAFECRQDPTTSPTSNPTSSPSTVSDLSKKRAGQGRAVVVPC